MKTSAALIAIAIAPLVLLSEALPQAPQANKPTQLIGTWRLVSRVTTLSSGQQFEDKELGSKALGYLVYDETGHVFAQLMRPNRTPTEMESSSNRMEPEEFRRQGHAVVDWIAEYYKRVESFPVLSQVAPGEIRASLPAQAPQQGDAFEQILADVDKLILPGVTHWQSPNFFAFFPS